jgi:hypothetical protein
MSRASIHANHCLFLWHRDPHVLQGSPATALLCGLCRDEANVSIETGEVLEGHLPVNAARLVKQWTLAHRDELQDNWRRARSNTPLVKIAGLDDD